MADKDLKFTISGDPSRYERAMDRVKGATTEAERLVGASFRAIAAAGAVAVGAYTLMAKEVLSAGDQIQKLGLRLGIATEFLSQMKHATDLSGVSFQAFTKGIQKMQENISDASNDIGTAKDSIADLGIDIEKLKALSPEAQFEAIAEAMRGISNESDRVRIAADIFGGRGVELVQLMGQGADGIRNMRREANALGLTLSQEGADSIAEFNDSLTRVKGEIMGVVQASVVSLGPTLTEMVRWFGEVLPDAINFTIESYNFLSRTLVETVKVATSGLIKFYDVLGMIPGKIGEPYREAAAGLREFSAEMETFNAVQIETIKIGEEFQVAQGKMLVPQETGEESLSKVRGIVPPKEQLDEDLQRLVDAENEKFEIALQSQSRIEQMYFESQGRISQMEYARLKESQRIEALKYKAVMDSGDRILAAGKMLLQGAAGNNKTLFEIVKAASIAKAVVGTYSGAAQALGEVPYPYNFVAAASVIAFGMAQVATIASQSFDSASTGSAAGSIGVPVVSETTAPVVDINPPGYGTETENKGSLNIYVENFIGEEAFVDELVKRINDAEDRDVYIRRSLTARAVG